MLRVGHQLRPLSETPISLSQLLQGIEREAVVQAAIRPRERPLPLARPR